MDVPPIMPLPVAVDVRLGVPIPVATPDSARVLAAMMEVAAQLSQSDVDTLIHILEAVSPPQAASETQNQLRAAVVAVQKGDPGAALKQLAVLIQLDPARADTLRTEPGLEPIRAQVNQLLVRLEATAGSDAQNRLADAGKALESWGRKPLPGWDMAPQVLLTAANRLYTAGGFVNYLRATALAGVVIEAARLPIVRSTPYAAAIVDTAAPLQLSQPDAGKLIRILEPPALPQQPSTSGDLLRAAVSAAQEGDPEGALNHLAEFVKIDPERANSLRTEPGLEPIRAQVDQLLVRVESTAGLNAQTQLAVAATVLEASGRQSLPGWDTPPQTLLTVANRLFSTGGYVNYLHAASIAEVVVEGAQPPPREPAAVAIVRLAASLQLSPPDTDRLLHILELPDLRQEPLDLPNLLRSAVSAAQKGDPGEALQHLEEFVRLDPNSAHTLRLEPGLEPIRTHVDQMLTRLESTARTDAHACLAEAGKVLESWGQQPQPGWDTAPQTVLIAANSLYDNGGYVNCLYAGAFAQVVIEGARFKIAATRRRPAASPRKSAAASQFGRRLKALWARAPLLILLLGWFVLGLLAMGPAAILHYFWPGQYPTSLIDNGFALWGIGFLALVVFGFYMRVRRIRFR